MQHLAGLICFLPILAPFMIAPLIIGKQLLARNSASALPQFAGWLTLKPLITTPIWLLLVGLTFSGDWFKPSPAYLLTALPGIIGTLIIVASYRSELCWSCGAEWVLLVLDTVRWGCSLLWGLSAQSNGLGCALIGLMLPSIYAGVAWILCNTNLSDSTTEPSTTSSHGQ